MGRSFCVITKICCSCYTTSKYNVEKGLSVRATLYLYSLRYLLWEMREMYNIRFSTLIYFKKHVLCVAVTLVGGYFKPVFCLLDILFSTLALKKTLA